MSDTCKQAADLLANLLGSAFGSPEGHISAHRLLEAQPGMYTATAKLHPSGNVAIVMLACADAKVIEKFRETIHLMGDSYFTEHYGTAITVINNGKVQCDGEEKS